MSALAALQRDFLGTLRHGGHGVLARLQAGRGVTPARGLAVYVHAYAARLREALRNDHAALAALLGEEAWEAMATDYIAACPSAHASLRHFGNALPDFLACHADYREKPLLAELAAFERRLLDSFDAADATIASWPALLAVPAKRWPSLGIAFVPSLAHFPSRHGAVEAWKALRRGAAPLAADAQPVDWAVWRDPGMVTRFRPLAAGESTVLGHFLAGGEFGAGCELLQGWHAPGDVPGFAVSLLRRWCSDGWIAGWRA